MHFDSSCQADNGDKGLSIFLRSQLSSIVKMLKVEATVESLGSI